MQKTTGRKDSSTQGKEFPLVNPFLFCHPWVFYREVQIIGENATMIPNRRTKKEAKCGFPIKIREWQKRGHSWMVLRGVHVFKNQKKKQRLGFPIKNFGNDGGGNPEWFYHPLSVTRQFLSRGPQYLRIGRLGRFQAERKNHKGNKSRKK